jgi:CheY-like chemotaxis protein
MRNRVYHLLVADDDEAFRETLRSVCEPYFEIVEARSGDEALDCARRLPLDFALCDMHMPELSGLDVLQEFKHRDARRPGILMTANCSLELRDRAKLIRVDSVLEKPFTRRQLLTAMAAAVETAFLDREFGHRVLADWPAVGGAGSVIPPRSPDGCS